MSNSIRPLLFGVALLLVAGLVQPVAGRAATETGSLIEGTVVEKIVAGGYTYVCIVDDGQPRWATTRGTTAEVGDEVEIASGSVMTDFTSESLGRTFDSIIFTNGIIKR